MSDKPLVLIQARTGSTRFPNKIFAEIVPGISMLAYTQRALRACDDIGGVYTLIPAEEIGLFGDVYAVFPINVPADDVMGRFVRFLLDTNTSPTRPIIRVTSDCPLLNAAMLTRFVHLAMPKLNRTRSIVTNRPLDADGFDMELFYAYDLLALYPHANSYEREHVTPALYANLDVCRVKCVYEYDALAKYSVDTPEDLEHVKFILKERDLS